MSSLYHSAILNSLCKTEDRLWEISKCRLNRERGTQAANRFSDVLADLKTQTFGRENSITDSATDFEPPSPLEVGLAYALIQVQGGIEKIKTLENRTLLEQFDELTHSLNMLEIAHQIIGILESGVEIESALKKILSSNAKKAAEVRHTENRQLKEEGLAWYAANKHNYSNKDDAAQDMTKIVPVKFRTARDWLINQ